MVEQRSFITAFGLDTVSDDERASITGNVVAMSQLGCIAGGLTYAYSFPSPSRCTDKSRSQNSTRRR